MAERADPVVREVLEPHSLVFLVVNLSAHGASVACHDSRYDLDGYKSGCQGAQSRYGDHVHPSSRRYAYQATINPRNSKIGRREGVCGGLTQFPTSSVPEKLIVGTVTTPICLESLPIISMFLTASSMLPISRALLIVSTTSPFLMM